jgi:hypothetical protein
MYDRANAGRRPCHAELVRELAERVGEPTATTLREALERESAVMAWNQQGLHPSFPQGGGERPGDAKDRPGSTTFADLRIDPPEL